MQVVRLSLKNLRFDLNISLSILKIIVDRYYQASALYPWVYIDFYCLLYKSLISKNELID